MKTAEEILYSHGGAGLPARIDAVKAMKEYATRVAEQVLKDAADNMDKECDDFGGLHDSMKNVILSTPIVTP